MLEDILFLFCIKERIKKIYEEKSNQKQASNKEELKTSDMVGSLDEFLDDDELNR